MQIQNKICETNQKTRDKLYDGIFPKKQLNIWGSRTEKYTTFGLMTGAFGVSDIRRVV